MIKVPIADGGEGTVEALITALGGEYRYAEVTGPIEGMTVRARYGISENRTAIIEMAQASGLPLLNENQRNPLLTTTYGTGELIRAALDEGIREFIIGIGGSATNDGGMGMAQALGIAFMDGVGKNVGFGGRYLSEVRQIVIDGLDPRIRESSITVICDVNNPLTGPRGATYIYGPQKGATEEMLKTLENGMKNYARVIQTNWELMLTKYRGRSGRRAGSCPYRFPRCCSEAGYRCHTEFINFDSLLDDVDLVVTGEVQNRRAVGVWQGARRSGQALQDQNVPVVAISGIMGRNAAAVYEYG